MSSTVPTVAPDSAARQRHEAAERELASPPCAQPLRGRNIGILCKDPQRAEVVDVQRVATGMGALVALVKPELGQADERTGLVRLARVLARFYDAVLCFDLPPSTVQELGEAAAIPVLGADGGEPRQRAAPGSVVEEQSRLLLTRLASLVA